MQKVTMEVTTNIMANFGSLNIREIDRKYISDMQRSIRFANTQLVDSIMTRFLAGKEPMPNESFRVIYYEYGTGALMRPPSWYSQGSDPYWNPARQDLHIWQRPKGTWYDAGGNRHESKTKGKPRRLSTKSRRGKPIEAPLNGWFRRGFWEGTRSLDKYILDAVKSVPITPYISIARIHKRM